MSRVGKMAAAPLYCVCRQPYDLNRFMIECDICKDWFHGRYGYLYTINPSRIGCEREMNALLKYRRKTQRRASKRAN